MTSHHTARAVVREDWPRLRTRIAIMLDDTHAFAWETPAVVDVPFEASVSEPDDRFWLNLPDDAARALYEALAEHFGHAGHDARALRADYNAERARVDKFIAHLTN